MRNHEVERFGQAHVEEVIKDRFWMCVEGQAAGPLSRVTRYEVIAGHVPADLKACRPPVLNCCPHLPIFARFAAKWVIGPTQSGKTLPNALDSAIHQVLDQLLLTRHRSGVDPGLEDLGVELG